jgi:protein O-mannosyl-transferase
MWADMWAGRIRDRSGGGWLTLAIVVAAGMIAYANSFAGRFILDDRNEIVSNPAIRTLWPPWEPMTGGHLVVARPLPYLTFAIDHAVWGIESPAGFHLVNVVAHLLTAVGLVVLTSGLLQRPVVPAGVRHNAGLLAGASGILWVVHPLATAAVTYIYQRIEVLASLFIVWSLVAAGRALAVPTQDLTRARQRRLWQAASLLAACLAAASKETAVAIPLLTAGLWWVFFAGQAEERLRDRLPFLLSLGVCWAVLAIVLATGRSDYPELQRAVYPPLRYALTQAGVLAHYARLVFWPVGLSIDHDWPLAAHVRDVWPQFLGVAAVLAVSITGFVRRAPWSYPLVAAFLFLGPTSSVLPLPDIAFEHRMYLPSFCLVVVVVCGICGALFRMLRELGGWEGGGRLAVIMGAGLLAITLCGMTRQRNREFASPEKLWQAVLARYPDSPRANIDAAFSRAAVGDRAGAIAHARTATLRSSARPVFQGVAQTFFLKGDLAGWEETCRAGQAALASCGKGESAAWFDLGQGVVEAIRRQGRVDEARALADCWAAAAAAGLGEGHAVTAALGLAALRCRAAGATGPAGCLDDAAAAMARFAESLGDDHRVTLGARTILAAALAERGRDREAEDHLRQIVRLERDRAVPDLVEIAAAMESLASFLLSRGRLEEAVEVRMAVCDLVCPAFGVTSGVAQKHLQLLESVLRASGRSADAAAILPLIEPLMRIPRRPENQSPG